MGARQGEGDLGRRHRAADPARAGSRRPPGRRAGVGRDPRLPAILADLYAARSAAEPRAGQRPRHRGDGQGRQRRRELGADGRSPPARDATRWPTWRRANGRPDMAGQADAGGAALRPQLRQGLPVARKLGATLAGFMIQPDGPQIAAVSHRRLRHPRQPGRGAGPAGDPPAPTSTRRSTASPRAWGRRGRTPRWWWSPSSAAPRASTAPTAPTTAPPRPRSCSAAR